MAASDLMSMWFLVMVSVLALAEVVFAPPARYRHVLELLEPLAVLRWMLGTLNH
jgi:hypothetical protein